MDSNTTQYGANSDKMAAIERYLSLGWATVQLHYIRPDGYCSCGERECRSPGKHPVIARWQLEVQRSIDHWAGAPFNVGIATGAPSGHWVLDYDPASSTAEAATITRRLCGEGYGKHVQTGGGGAHWRFVVPPDFEVTNRRGSLPAGLDVRGTGGQVVAPPSVSGKGPYVELSTAAPYVAPAWLLDMIRPATPTRAAPAGWSADTGDRGQRYAAGAMRAMLTQLRDASSGRNALAFQHACRIVEMTNAGWLDARQAYEAWRDATHAHPDGIVVPTSEVDSVWRSARRTAGEASAVLPADDPLDLSAAAMPALPPWEPPPFSELSNGPVLLADPSTNVDETLRETTHETRETSQVTDVVDALIAEMLTVEQLRLIPPPEPLIMGLLDVATTAWLVGRSETYKSFVALDIAAHVGRGDKWRGRWTRQGLVIYIVAEGARGMRLRADAWEREYGAIDNVRFLPRPVQADERRMRGEWSVLVAALARLAPVLVIIDTQARVTVGLGENDAADMGLYVEQADRIKRATGACVLTVHHLGRQGTEARGSSALDGAQDSELRVQRVADGMVELHVDKQKDLAKDAPIRLRLMRSDGGTDPATGRDLSSLVVDRAEVPIAAPAEADLTTSVAALAGAAFTYASQGNGQTKSEMLRRVVTELGLMSRATFMRAWNDALERKILCKVAERDSYRYVGPDDRERVDQWVGGKGAVARYWLFPDDYQG